jgi:hypothetical protein
MNRNRATIGGALNYRQLAELNRPADPSAQIQRMHSEGLTPRDIASHLGVHIDIVLRALRTETGTNREPSALGANPATKGKEGPA